MRPALLLLLATGAVLGAQDFGRLPDWARAAAQEAAKETPPAGAEAWVLLERTEIAYAGVGEIRKRHQRLVQVLTEKGTEAGVHAIHGLGGKASRVKKLKGWNLRPDGELVKLDQDEIVTVDSDSGSELSTGLLTGAVLNRVVRGSFVAFESQEVIRHPLGAVAMDLVMEAYPIRRWELTLAKKEGWFTDLKAVETRITTRHFEPWIAQAEILPGQSVRIANVPGLPQKEGAVPPWRNVLPQVSVAFLDPALASAPSVATWDTLATWFHGVYMAKCAPSLPTGFQAQGGQPGLAALVAWMARELRYRQVYLSPERGWIPEAAQEVHRRRLGDCKDLSVCLIAGVRQLGFEAFPALALIGDGELEEGEPVNPFAFNHVITAIRLPATLGLPAEVETPKGRFLLVDPTSRTTPLGRLHAGHEGRKVFVCTGDGGFWAAVPQAAIERPGTALVLDGSIQAAGRLVGTLTILEDADHLSLRSALLQGGRPALDSAVQAVLDLPPNGSFKVEEAGDPLALGVPFKVRVRVEHPDWFRREGSEFVLRPYGVPGSADLIQKPGEARRYPVWMGLVTHWSFKAHLAVPGAFAPVKASNQLETPLRMARSEAKAGPGTLDLSLDLDRRKARYGFEAREEGVKLQKRDRNQWKLFLEEFGSFKPGAP
ncbi:MAG: hypothetical protein IPL96_02740 [Holophagaceae bacterium]|nr:hypothetical protein [Holophagaceae bacterium]